LAIKSSPYKQMHSGVDRKWISKILLRLFTFHNNFLTFPTITVTKTRAHGVYISNCFNMRTSAWAWIKPKAFTTLSPRLTSYNTWRNNFITSRGWRFQTGFKSVPGFIPLVTGSLRLNLRRKK